MIRAPVSHPGQAESTTSSMPMPQGLMPVGNAVKATGNARPGIPRPPSNVLGAGAGTL